MDTRTDRVEIAYRLVFETPFHCGTGIRTGLIDRTIVEDSHGYLYVPGTTFKGVLREHCEQIARFYEESDEMQDRLASPHDKSAALYGLGHAISMVTRIFGSPYYAGQLYFDDARLDEEEKDLFVGIEGDERHYRGLQKDIYTQVRLDRPTRTALEGALYTSEFGVRGLIFEGNITGLLTCFPIDESDSSAPTYSLLLLLAGMSWIEQLGGNRSTGKGKCRCEIQQVIVNENDAPWESWFDRLGELENYSTAVAMAAEEEAA
jgi:CRISPR/Cas system CMR subunit Cmr4 (Cas7 group RAMP superfamily)